MAMMAKMRSLAPAFIISVGALFVLFMVVSDSSVMQALGGRSNNVGSINGEDVSYQEYTKLIDQMRENQKQQTGKDVEADQMDQFRDQVWDALVTQKLVAEKVKEFGISVSDKEIEDAILGPNPPEFLKRSFIDSTGKFNRQMYENALFDPRNKEALINAEDFVRQQKTNEKLQSMLLASVTVSNNEVRRNFIDQNTKIDAKFALVPVNQFVDSIFSINDEELKDYYNNHIDQYKIEAQRKLKYVMFSTRATKDDTVRVQSTLENVKNSLQRDTTTFKEAVSIYSDDPYSLDTVSLANLQTDAADALYKSSKGDVVGPVAVAQGYALYNVVDIVPTKNTVVHVSHILINQFGSEEKNREEAMKIYNELKKGADFAALAKEKSGDPGSARNGGDLGWFGRGRMVKEFEEASFNGPVGVVQKPVKTSYGYHIIKVTGKTNKDYVVEKIVEQVKPSATTVDNIYNTAGDYAYLAQKNDFKSEADLMKYQIRETAPFTKTAYAIPGIGVNKHLIDFAFNNDVGTVSDVYKVASGYVVAQVAGKINEGVKPFDEVKNQVKAQVLREMKFKKAGEMANKIAGGINGNLDNAKSIDPKAVVEETGEFAPNGSVPKVGRDYAFIDKALEIDVNKISEPFKGQRGYYLIKVLSRTPFDSSAYAIQKNQIKESLLQQKRNTFFSQWVSDLKKNADIVDNRYKFFTH